MRKDFLFVIYESKRIKKYLKSLENQMQLFDQRGTAIRDKLNNSKQTVDKL